jgi:hypothetical protein
MQRRVTVEVALKSPLESDVTSLLEGKEGLQRRLWWWDMFTHLIQYSASSVENEHPDRGYKGVLAFVTNNELSSRGPVCAWV